uniref:Uncharacterized protein n=1 Tax=Cereibacter sphaeroides (strain ATCC 17025 / ATH 2.4.3) TaxID=349102 RepID=A4WTB4_CERS5
MRQDLPLSPRDLVMTRHHAEHSPNPEIRETAHRLLTDHELAVATGRPLHRALPRPVLRKPRPAPSLTGFLVGLLALVGFAFAATVLWAHASDVAETMARQSAAMRGM